MERLFHVLKTTILKGRAIQNNLKGNWFKMSQSDFLLPVEPSSHSWRLPSGVRGIAAPWCPLMHCSDQLNTRWSQSGVKRKPLYPQEKLSILVLSQNVAQFWKQRRENFYHHTVVQHYVPISNVDRNDSEHSLNVCKFVTFPVQKLANF